ncbi:MAG: aspartyl-phosphate phosphatase Spo0E family protein [Clostridium sp.]
MVAAKEELVEQIELARKKLNDSIDQGVEYKKIYTYSVELDKLLNQYMVLAG